MHAERVVLQRITEGWIDYNPCTSEVVNLVVTTRFVGGVPTVGC